MISNNFFIKVNKDLLLGLIFMVLSISLFAQEKVQISLDEVKSKAKENNTDLKITQQDYAIAKANYEQTRAVILPKLNVSNTSSFTNNPLNAFGFKLLQKSVTIPDFDPGALNNPGQVENFNTRIELLQPLINVDGWKKRKASNLQLQAASLQSERAYDYLELEVIKTYMQLQLAYKSVRVMEKAKQTALENKKIAQNSLNLGLIQNADFLNVEVRLTEIENQLQYANSNIKNVSDYLAFLIGENNNIVYQPNSELSLNGLIFNESVALNKNRGDIQAIQFGVEAQEQMFKSSKLSFVPRANAFANYEWNDKEVFGFGANNYLFGLQLSWDIFGGYQNIGKIHYEKAQLEKANLNKNNYIEQSKLELNKTKRQLIDVKNNVTLSKLALDQSEEALRIKTNRFEQGLEKTADLLFVETQFQQKELDYSQAVFNYNYTLAYLNYLTK
ncbi:Efflux transport system, outer membrane factor (OMF) lipoprotein [hydrothermal vent metagenome]|uniref:Efflux transport system, outer membrane factor (OMF) lipoprotein n=1 Tax=hydrothermal vent metagenome TaxID=652676 RepID=A0A3B0RDW6_9ZZZZ